VRGSGNRSVDLDDCETEFENGDGEIRCVGPGNALRLDFDRRLMLQFRGSLITSDASQGLPPPTIDPTSP
jgi:hypothetical protein